MKKILSLTLMVSLLALNSFMLLEGGMANAATTSSAVTSGQTGVWPTTTVGFDINQEVTTQLSLMCEFQSATMTDAIDGLTGGQANTSTDCNVKTNAIAGYKMWLSASDTPALEHNSSTTVSFADFSGTIQDWSAGCTAADACFGFSVSGDDKDAVWNAGGYQGFSGATQRIAATRTVATPAAGVTTSIAWRAEVGNAHSQEAGFYTAHVTVTAAAQ